MIVYIRIIHIHIMKMNKIFFVYHFVFDFFFFLFYHSLKSVSYLPNIAFKFVFLSISLTKSEQQDVFLSVFCLIILLRPEFQFVIK